MANKYFKATLTPKKSHPDSPAEIVTYTDAFKTQKEFSDQCLKELAEVENVTLWFAPKIEKVTQEEFEANNDNEPEITLEDSQRPTEGEIRDQFAIDHSGKKKLISLISNELAGYENEVLERIIAIVEETNDWNATKDDSEPVLYGENITIDSACEFLAYMVETCQMPAHELLNIRNIRGAMRSYSKPRIDNAPHKSTTTLQVSGEIEELKEQYHFFQYAKGYPILVKLQQLSGKVRASYMFDSNQFIEIDKEFTSLENGLVNALGYVLSDCTDAGVDDHAWAKATVKCIGSRDPDRFFHESIISYEEVLKFLESEPEVKNDTWETNDDIKYKKLYSKIVDVIADYNGEQIPSARDCYDQLVMSVPPKYIDVADLENRILREIAQVKNPHNFTNATNATQIIMQAFRDLYSAERLKSTSKTEAKQEIEQKPESAMSRLDGKFNHIESACFCLLEYDYCNIEMSGEKLSDVKYFLQLGHEIYKDAAYLTSKEEAIVFALNRVKCSMLCHFDRKNVEIAFSKIFENPVEWFDSLEKKNESHVNYIRMDNSAETLPPTTKNEPLDTKSALEVVKSDPETAESLPTDFEIMVNDYNEKIESLDIGEVIIFDDMPNEIYHAVVGVSSSKIKDAMRSLMYFDAKHNTKEIEPETGDQFDVGNVFHSITLEPDMTSKEYIREPSGDDIPKKPSSDQWTKFNAWHALGCPEKADNPKAYPTDLMLERCGFWKDFYEENANLYPVDADNWQLAENMAISALSDSDSSLLLKHPARKTERSYFKRCEITGMIIKARPDIEVGKIIGDLKSIALRGNFDEKYLLTALRKEIFNRNYHLSAAMYLDICGKDRFVWIFTNKQKGYHWTATLRASAEILDRGRELYIEYKQKIADAYNSGNWSKPESIQSRVNPESGKIELPEV